jgi:hypothetical protein
MLWENVVETKVLFELRSERKRKVNVPPKINPSSSSKGERILKGSLEFFMPGEVNR